LNPNLLTISERDSYEDDENDSYAYGDEDYSEEAEIVTDTDMLPTVLVYRAGQLIHNWIRVDWEAEAWVKRKEGSLSGSAVESLLRG